MLRRAALIVFAIAALGIFLAWATSPDPRFNPASFEDQPLVTEVAPITDAITIAQYLSESGVTVTLLVTGYGETGITGIDLADLGAPRLEDPFAVLATIDRGMISSAASNAENVISVNIARLLPAGPRGDRHIAVGTNFPEHADEASSGSVFLFPKFGTATPSRTTVTVRPEGLFDYEVELCLRFDRPIETLADFDAAAKGLFLCGDFTRRVDLLELADPDNLDSGFGFSDAKSGPGFFPTGPLLVIPNNLESFVDSARMTTEMNGEPRQDARGGEMILDFRALTKKALSEMGNPRFYFQSAFYTLAPYDRIEADMALMSGTSEGVIFTMPTRRDYIEMIVDYIRAGGPLSGKSVSDIGIQTFIGNEIQSGHFLNAGDVVTYRSSFLGDIVVDVKN